MAEKPGSDRELSDHSAEARRQSMTVLTATGWTRWSVIAVFESVLRFLALEKTEE